MEAGETLSHFRLDIDEEGVATVTIDREGEDLNTVDPALMEDFEAILARLEDDPKIRAVVLTSGKADGFMAGANIKWFSELTVATATEGIRRAHQLLSRLERLHTTRGKPVVAAIHGACLGAGCEIALACSHRLASDHPATKLGQPEVQLGVIPAAGGTQRLPRLVGVTAALDLILTGRSVDADRSARIGLVDEVVPSATLQEAARRTALAAIGEGGGAGPRGRLPERLQELALEKNPLGRAVLFGQARRRLLARTKGHYPAPERALEAVRTGLENGFAAGLAAEARHFADLVVSPESRALRSIFFATRGGPTDDRARPVEKLAVVGGGLMGGGIATVSTLNAGVTVRVKEVDVAGVARAKSYVSRVLTERVERRRMRPFDAERAQLRVTGATHWRGFADADLVIEAVFEDLDLKQSVLREVEGLVNPRTVFASNTSSIPISAIASASDRPETVLGMHYFSPVEKMPLLEVVVTGETAGWAEATAVAFGRRQGKTVIVVADGPGFYTTRILGPYSAEALQLLAEGARVEDVDAALETWGFPVGPLRLADEVGLDVGGKIASILVDALGERMADPGTMRRLIEAGRHGRKNRKGFYSYDASGKRGGVDDSVYVDLGVSPDGGLPRSSIQERLTLAMINEAARCLEEEILRSASDGDVGAVMGLGFPPFRGGPFFWIDEQGAGLVVERLEDLASEHGERFAPAGILVEAARSGRRFRG